MVCFHSRYNLGDDGGVHGLKSAWFDGWDAMEAHLRRPLDIDDPSGYLGSGEGAIAVLPLYLYDHSGITMNTEGFSCPWNSGQVGFIYATKESIAKIFGEETPTLERIEECLKHEVKAYDQYLTGDIWSYAIEDEAGEILDSCCGFYGHDEAQREAEEVLSNLEKSEQARP